MNPGAVRRAIARADHANGNGRAAVVDNAVFPDELLALPRWGLWGWRLLGDNKRTKVPFQPMAAAKLASSTDLSTWGSYELAAAKLADPRVKHLVGLAFVFAEDDPYVGVDLDDCAKDCHLIHPAAQAIIDALDSWWEFSPSGTGIHIIVRGKKPEGFGCKGMGEWGGKIECYERGRYFTMTGATMTGGEIRECTTEIATIAERYLPPAAPAGEIDWNRAPTESVDDDALLARAREDDPRLAELYETTPSDEDDRSSLDFALCCKLAEVTDDPRQIERLMSASALGQRDKWTTRQDYRRRTIEKAIGRAAEDGDDIEIVAQEATLEVAEQYDVTPLTPAIPMHALQGGMKQLVEAGVATGKPAAYVAGAALVAAAATIGSLAEVQLGSGWSERVIIWAILFGPPGWGKSPSQSMGLEAVTRECGRQHAKYREDMDTYKVAYAAWKEAKKNEGTPEPARPRLALPFTNDFTFESLARSMDKREGSVSVNVDELSGLLTSFNQYKGGAGSDRSRALTLWDGAAWHYTRVGRGGEGNGLEIYITKPTLSIVGGLQPEVIGLLGGGRDGMKDRWLLFAADGVPRGNLQASADAPLWDAEIARIRERIFERTWTLSNDAQALFQEYQSTSRETARRTDTPPAVAGALLKADRQAARIALVLAELRSDSNVGGEIGVDILRDAIEIVQFSAACWRSEDVAESTTVIAKEKMSEALADKLHAHLKIAPGQSMSARDAQRSKSYGRTAAQWHDTLAAFKALHPGCVVPHKPRSGPNSVEIHYSPPRPPSTR